MPRIGNDVREVQRHRDKDEAGQGGCPAADHHEVVAPDWGVKHQWGLGVRVALARKAWKSSTSPLYRNAKTTVVEHIGKLDSPHDRENVFLSRQSGALCRSGVSRRQRAGELP